MNAASPVPSPGDPDYWNSPASLNWTTEHALIDRALAPMTGALLAVAAPAAGERVIDVGCGSGTTVLALAGHVGPEGGVLGVDVAARSLERARARVIETGVRGVTLEVGDAATHGFAPGGADLVFSRFGVMFFADPVAAFGNLRRAVRPGGRLALAAWRAAAENPWSTAPLGAVRHLLPPMPPPPDPEAPGQFAFGDAARVRRILEGAGWGAVALTPHEFAMPLAGPGGAAEAAEFALRFGPAARASATLPAAEQAAVRAALEAHFSGLDGPGGIALPASVWFVTARC